MSNLFDLTGRLALVTGSSRGIGQGMALGLAEAGADIIGVSATLPADGGETGRQVRALGRQFHAYQADFSDQASADAFSRCWPTSGASIFWYSGEQRRHHPPRSGR